MCEANETLNRAKYELDQMWGRGVIDYPRLKQLLENGCTHLQGLSGMEGHE